MTLSGKGRRAKGAAYERKLAHLFLAAMPGEDIKRGIQDRAGDKVADVDCPVFWIEAKKSIRGNPRAALKQAQEASEGTGKVPLAVIADDRKEAFVCLSLDHFLDFVSEWFERGQR
jgi:hypothetical protein